MSMMRPLAAAISAVVGLALTAPPTFAKDFYPTQACVAAKLKAASKKCQADLKAWSKFDSTGDTAARDTAISAASGKLATAFQKAEDKALSKNVDCSQTSLTSAEMSTAIDNEASALTTQINTGLTLPGDGKCGAKLLKAAATTCAGYLKAESGYFKKFAIDPQGAMRDTNHNKVATKFTTKYDGIVTGGCPATTTSAAAETSIDGINNQAVSDTTTSPDLSTTWTQVTPPAVVPYLGGLLGPVCTHATPYSFFYKRGTTDPNKLLVYYQGGGACWDSVTCSAPVYDPDVTASDNPANTTTGFGDLANPSNPFSGWSAVFVAYCSADVHWGDKGPSASHDGVHHMGWENAKVVEKFAREHFVNPNEVFVTGSSAGAYGAILHGIYLHEVYLASTFNVVGDAGNGVITPAFLTGSLEPAWGVEVHLPTYIGLSPHVVDLTIADLYIAGANHYASRGSRFGQYSSAYDGGGGSQTFFYNVMVNGILDNGSWWHSSCAWNTQALQFSADADAGATNGNYKSYFGPGSRHTIWGSNRVYTETHGVTQTFVSWLNDMRSSPTWGNVACADCSLLGGCSALAPVPGASCQHDAECSPGVCNLVDAKPGFTCNPSSANSGAPCARDSDCTGVGAACSPEASFGVCSPTSTVNANMLCANAAACDGTPGSCVTEQPFQLDGVVSCPP